MEERRYGIRSSLAIAVGILAGGCSTAIATPDGASSATMIAEPTDEAQPTGDALPSSASTESAGLVASIRSSFLTQLEVPPSEPPPPAAAPWTHAHGGSGDDGATSIARSGSNLITGGWLGASGDVGCGMHTMPGYAGYVAAYDPDGACLWSSYFEGADWVSAVATDPNGAIYVTGTFAGTVTFGGETYTSNEDSTDVFVAKLGANGAIQWVQTIGSADEDYVYAIAATSGRVAIGGSHGAAMTDFASALTSNGGGDGFVVEYDTGTGALSAAHAFGGTGWDSVDALAYAPDGALAVGGNFAGTVDFGLGPIASAGGQDGVVVVYEPGGATRAVRRIGGKSSDAVHAMTYDSSGQLVVAGYFRGAGDVNGGQSLVGEGDYTGFVTTWNRELTVDKVLTMPASKNLLPSALDPLPGGGFVVAGSFTGTARLGTKTIVSSGSEKSAFVATYTYASGWTWAEASGTGAEAMGVKVADTGAIVAVGTFDGSIGTAQLSTAGSGDAFVVSFVVP